MKYENHYTYRTEWSIEDNCFISRVLEFPSLSTFGDTREESQRELDLVIEETLAWMIEDGENIPTPLSKKEYKGNVALRIPPETHRSVSILAAQEGISINQFITSLIERNMYCDSFSHFIQSFEQRLNSHY